MTINLLILLGVATIYFLIVALLTVLGGKHGKASNTTLQSGDSDQTVDSQDSDNGEGSEGIDPDEMIQLLESISKNINAIEHTIVDITVNSDEIINRNIVKQQKLDNVIRLIIEWDSKQGHDACWFYPEIFEAIAKELDIVLINKPTITKERLEAGCRRFTRQFFEQPINNQWEHGNGD